VQCGLVRREVTYRATGMPIRALAETTRPGGRRRLGENKARRLHELAEKTVAPPELDAQMSFEVGMLIQQFDLLAKQIEIAKQRVAEVLDSELARRLAWASRRGRRRHSTVLRVVQLDFRRAGVSTSRRSGSWQSRGRILDPCADPYRSGARLR
jgi:hypothetical protein